jgi:hypothetical protein
MASSSNHLGRESLNSMGRLYWSRVYYEGYSHHSTCDFLQSYGYTDAQVFKIVRWAQSQIPQWEREEAVQARAC